MILRHSLPNTSLTLLNFTPLSSHQLCQFVRQNIRICSRINTVADACQRIPSIAATNMQPQLQVQQPTRYVEPSALTTNQRQQPPPRTQTEEFGAATSDDMSGSDSNRLTPKFIEPPSLASALDRQQPQQRFRRPSVQNSELPRHIPQYMVPNVRRPGSQLAPTMNAGARIAHPNHDNQLNSYAFQQNQREKPSNLPSQSSSQTYPTSNQAQAQTTSSTTSSTTTTSTSTTTSTTTQAPPTTLVSISDATFGSMNKQVDADEDSVSIKLDEPATAANDQGTKLEDNPPATAAVAPASDNQKSTETNSDSSDHQSSGSDSAPTVGDQLTSETALSIQTSNATLFEQSSSGSNSKAVPQSDDIEEAVKEIQSNADGNGNTNSNKNSGSESSIQPVEVEVPNNEDDPVRSLASGKVISSSSLNSNTFYSDQMPTFTGRLPDVNRDSASTFKQSTRMNEDAINPREANNYGNRNDQTNKRGSASGEASGESDDDDATLVSSAKTQFGARSQPLNNKQNQHHLQRRSVLLNDGKLNANSNDVGKIKEASAANQSDKDDYMHASVQGSLQPVKSGLIRGKRVLFIYGNNEKY